MRSSGLRVLPFVPIFIFGGWGRFGSTSARVGAMKSNSAHALSSSSSNTRPASSNAAIRIFSFGDSLTAGTSPPKFQNFPYAPHLEAALQPKFPDREVVVRHSGHPGWQASQLLDDSDSAGGLRTTIRKIQNPSLSLVIILAGTNDMGYQRGPAEIIESVRALHELCHREQVPNMRTMAIAVPPSGYQSMNADAAEVARQVNEGIKKYCEGTNGRSTYFAFPFGWSRDDNKWSSDGLHFSPKGYQVLGEGLAPAVEQILSQVVS